MNEERVKELSENLETSLKRIRESFSNISKSFTPTNKQKKKKRGAGYTKRRVSKRTGKSSSRKSK